MLHEAKISITKMRNNIIAFGIINCIIYVILVLLFKYLNLLHISGLRMLNFFPLAFVSMYQVHYLVKNNNGYIPFLQVFTNTFFTGTFSFLLFSVFLFFYTWFDPYMEPLYFDVAQGSNRFIPAFLLFAEGSGGSIIVAMVIMKYANRYADSEAKI